MRVKRFNVTVLQTVTLLVLLSTGAIGATTAQDAGSDSPRQALGASLADLEALVATLDEQVTRLQELSGEVKELGQALAEAEAAAAEEQRQLEQTTDESASAGLAGAAPGAHAAAGTGASGATGEGLPMPAAIEELDELITGLRDAIADLKARCAAARTVLDLAGANQAIQRAARG
jgi:DNA repair exonuclease SbcCD ATPase subunit